MRARQHSALVDGDFRCWSLSAHRPDFPFRRFRRFSSAGAASSHFHLTTALKDHRAAPTPTAPATSAFTASLKASHGISITSQARPLTCCIHAIPNPRQSQPVAPLAKLGPIYFVAHQPGALQVETVPALLMKFRTSC